MYCDVGSTNLKAIAHTKAMVHQSNFPKKREKMTTFDKKERQMH